LSDWQTIAQGQSQRQEKALPLDAAKAFAVFESGVMPAGDRRSDLNDAQQMPKKACAPADPFTFT
jgi:hypothetical protein